MAERIVMANRVYETLYAAGVVQEHPGRVARAVIDLRSGEPVRIYIERFGDEKLGEALVAQMADLPEATEGV